MIWKRATEREYKSSSLTLNHHKTIWWNLYQELFAFFQDIREKNEAFGSSLLLANSPMSPKVVNGSFAAIIDADEFLAKAYAGIRIAVSSAGKHLMVVFDKSLAGLSRHFLLFIFYHLESRFTGDATTSPWDFNVGPAVLARLAHGSGDSRYWTQRGEQRTNRTGNRGERWAAKLGRYESKVL